MHKLESRPGRVAVAGFAAALSLGAVGVATAAAAPQTSARVVSFAAPSDHALLRSTTVPVRIKVGSQVTGIQVFAGTKDISARFTRQGSAFTARLPRSVLKPGTNTLLVQAKARGGKAGGAASLSVIVPRAGKTAMRSLSGAKASSLLNAGPTGTPSYQPTPGQVPVTITTKTATYARLTVNGRRVSDLRASRATTEHDWLVSVRDGLKVGKNTFVVESWDAQGRHTIKRWTVNRDRSLPLTEAGPRERVVKPRGWTTLDGSKSQATRKGAKLTYKWRVVRAPAGANPQLRDANSPKPQFKTDKPGVYQVALSAAQTTPGAHAAAVAPASEDVVTLDAVPPLGPQGLYVDTGYFGADGTNKGAGPFNTLYIEGQPFSASYNGHPDTFVQLDETTLAVKASGNHTQITPTAGTITIGAWMDTNISDAPGGWGSAMWIGTKQVALNATDDDPGDGNGNPTSNLHGWLKPASQVGTDNASWVDSDMLQVKTRQPTDTPTQNTMEINGTQYRQTLASGQAGGWQLMVLNNSAHVVTNALYPNGQEDQLATAISNVGFGYTVLLQAFGNVPAVSSASNLGNVIQTIGGRTDVVDRFNGKADSTGGVYALISGASSTANNAWSNYAADEASFERTGTSGTLTSLLVRDANDNDYIPFNSDTAAPDVAGSNRYDFLPLVYAAPTDWTNWMRNSDGSLRAPTAAENAALSDLVSQVVSNGWVPTKPLCPAAPDAIRAMYCTTDATQLTTLGQHFSSSTQLPFNAGTAGGRYTEADWDNVKSTIQDELGDVANVRSAIAHYQALFGTASIDGAVNAPAIGTAISQAIDKSTTVATNAQLDNIISALAGIASTIPEVGPDFTVISSAFSLMSDLEPDTSNQAILDQVQVTQATAATTLVARLQSASTQLSTFGDDLVSDPSKLRQGARYLMNNDPTTASDSQFVLGAEYATQQWLWGTELAPFYTAWSVPKVLGYSPDCSNGDYFGQPWNSLQTSGTWISSSGIGALNQTSHWLLGYDANPTKLSDQWGYFVHGAHLEPSDISLPGSITNPLFGLPVSTTSAPSVTANAGAIMPYFALDYLRVKSPQIMPKDKWDQNPTATGCDPHAGIPSTLP